MVLRSEPRQYLKHVGINGLKDSSPKIPGRAPARFWASWRNKLGWKEKWMDSRSLLGYR